MRKDLERKLGRNLFVKEGLNAKEVAERVKVDPATVGRWRQEDNWDDLRMAEMTSSDTLINDLKDDIRNFIEMRQKNEISASKSADGISKLQKVIATLSANKISLEQFLFVMNYIFRHLQNEHPEIFKKTLDFQDDLLIKIAKEFG